MGRETTDEGHTHVDPSAPRTPSPPHEAVAAESGQRDVTDGDPGDGARVIYETAMWDAENNIVDEDNGDLIAHAVTYENQRWYPVSGWSATLLPTDRYRWSSKDGRQERKREDWQVPTVWGHPPDECEWRDAEWSVEVGPGTDHAGWTYAFDFKREGEYSPLRRASDCVRRRCWKRVARVKRDFQAERSKAKEAHTVRCAALHRLAQHEAARVAALRAETEGADSLRLLVLRAIAETKLSAKSVAGMADSINTVCKHQAALGKVLRQMHTPSQASDAPPADNPVAALHVTLNAQICRVAETLTSSTASESSDVVKSITVLSDSMNDACNSYSKQCKSETKKLSKPDDECRGLFNQAKTAFETAEVTTSHTHDLWLMELAYAEANHKFATAFDTYKEAMQNALIALHGLEGQSIDMMNVAGNKLSLLLTRVGINRMGERHGDEKDKSHGDDKDKSQDGGKAKDEKEEEILGVWQPPTRDISKVGDRAGCPDLSPLSSELVVKKGVLELKRLLGWTKFLAICTVDRWVYLLEQPREGRPLSHPSVGLNLANCEIMPHPEHGPGCFIVTGVTKGFFGHSEKNYKFKAATEEEMVDWMVFLKQRS